MKGWVYVLSNESLDGLIKIGYSSKDPGSRAKELSGDTGVPTPFIVEYEMLVEDPYGCEQRAHKILDDKRVNQNREFFRCSVTEVDIRNFPLLPKSCAGFCHGIGSQVPGSDPKQ